MKTMSFIALAISLTFVQFVTAQETEQPQNVKETIALLNAEKEIIENEEKEALRVEIEAIMKRYEDGEITQDESIKLKQEAAERRALNIENRKTIIANKIALIERNGIANDTLKDNGYTLSIGLGTLDRDDNTRVFGIQYKNNNKVKDTTHHDVRTFSEFVLATSFMYSSVNDQSLSNSPYDVSDSGSFELGISWNTRVFKNTNFLRFKYGLSFVWNTYSLDNNNYFVVDGNQNNIVEFSEDLDKSELRLTNLVVPLFFEFGPSKKTIENGVTSYNTLHKVKFGIGGYGGFNIGSMQKLKYKVDGDRVKTKEKRDFNTTDFVYGLSAYAGYGGFSLYAKYGLNDTFTDSTLQQNDFSIGLRIDF